MKYALTLSMTVATLALAACGSQTEAPAAHTEAPAAETVAAETTPTVVAGAVTIEDAWCRPSPNGAKAGGCYVILTSSLDDTLTGISTDQADMAQVHEMKMEDGVMKMAHLDKGLPLVANQRTELKPHGNHIMLMGLKAPLVSGQTAKITLTFEKAAPATVDFDIRTPPMVGGEQ
ncbi:copper chaperone PCu(A)C [Brevundimonas sp.]